jgi:hypothetical protein
MKANSSMVLVNQANSSTDVDADSAYRSAETEDQQASPAGRIVRNIGILRGKAKIGLQNLAYNIRRPVTSGAARCSI